MIYAVKTRAASPFFRYLISALVTELDVLDLLLLFKDIRFETVCSIRLGEQSSLLEILTLSRKVVHFYRRGIAIKRLFRVTGGQLCEMIDICLMKLDHNILKSKVHF